jgi:hypothetical protein
MIGRIIGPLVGVKDFLDLTLDDGPVDQSATGPR